MKTQIKKIEWTPKGNGSIQYASIDGFGEVVFLVATRYENGFEWIIDPYFSIAVKDDENPSRYSKAETIEAAKAEIEAVINGKISDLINRFTEPVPYDVTFIAGPE